MPPNTHHSQAMAKDACRSVGRDDAAQLHDVNLQRRKCTLASIQVPSSTTTSSTPLVPHGPPPAKKMRHDGPPRARPIQRGLRQDKEKENPEEDLTGIDNRRGKGKRTPSTLPQTSSLPTSYDDSSPANHVPNLLDGESDQFVSTDSEGYVETEVDWFDEPQLVETAKRHPSKMSEAIALERPCWIDPITSSGTTLASASVGTTPGGRPIGTSLKPGSLFVWPSETDLILFPGTTKIMLTLQLPLVRTVLQDAFENLRAALLFEHTFPDLNLTVLFIRKTLVGAARSHLPRAVNIHRHLLVDDAYLDKLSHLPCARVPLFRAEAKERCAAIIQSSFAVIPPSNVAETVEMELSDYRYTFPTMNIANGLQSPPMHTRPYRNKRIITVIQDLYFTGGTQTFFHRFVGQFPRYQDNNGIDVCEVPIPMVALVATALYAAIYEWRSGSHQLMEFSANAFLDVYQGHVDTLNHIRDRRTSAFHVMMHDIFKKAQSTARDANVGVPIANIKLEEIDE